MPHRNRSLRWHQFHRFYRGKPEPLEPVARMEPVPQGLRNAKKNNRLLQPEPLEPVESVKNKRA
jgi:hypothetical protein